jgi:predicted metal-dependent phosphoesterase TrpH
MTSTPARAAAWGLIAAAFVSGAVADRTPRRVPIEVGGYRVIAADFHTHGSLWSDGALTPFGLVLAAERQGLDAIAITGHDQVSDAKAGRWFSSLIGGPTVLVGEEMLGADHHVIAVGIDHVIHLPTVAEQVAEVHRQGGVAIAAHPVASFWPGFTAGEKAQLDGSEICHPLVYGNAKAQAELDAFRQGASLAAIGSSDFHGFARIGQCRTYVFAADNSSAAIVDAIRAHRTVVYTPDGRTYGDPALAALIASRADFRADATTDASPSVLDWISRVCGLIGLAALLASHGRKDARETEVVTAAAINRDE